MSGLRRNKHMPFSLLTSMNVTCDHTSLTCQVKMIHQVFLTNRTQYTELVKTEWGMIKYWDGKDMVKYDEDNEEYLTGLEWRMMHWTGEDGVMNEEYWIGERGERTEEYWTGEDNMNNQRQTSQNNRLSHLKTYLMKQRYLKSTNTLGYWMSLRLLFSLKPRKRISVCVLRSGIYFGRLTEVLLKCISVLTVYRKQCLDWRHTHSFSSHFTFTTRSCLVMAEVTRRFFMPPPTTMPLQLQEESWCLESGIFQPCY